MKISHESPICMLEDSLNFNDYDYALVHLFEKYPDYYNFYKKCVKLGREVILDNSLYELGEAFSSSLYDKYIHELLPTYYIIPDNRNLDKHFKLCEEWFDNYYDLNISCKTIGVVHGKTYEEIKQCYKFIDNYADKIAFSFNYGVYNELFPSINENLGWMNGRILLINKLVKDGIINTKKPHHLLGIALPQEVLYYRDFNFIDSIDTSNPILHGYLNINYNSWGLLNKSSIKMDSLINNDFSKHINTIKYNIGIFRRLANGV